MPASALDGYVLDENEVFNAITQFDTNSIETQSDILEAVEAFTAPTATVVPAAESVEVPESVAPPVSAAPVSIPEPLPLPSAPLPSPVAVAPPPAKPKNQIKHGFDF